MFHSLDWQVTALLVVAAAGLLIGFIWMVRTDRADPETDQRAWRYRNRTDRTSKPRIESHASHMTRSQVGRSLARVELAVAGFTSFVLAPFLFVAKPSGIDPMFSGLEWWQEPALAGIAVAGILIGFTWMLRIHRADTEPDQHAWRYRERD